MGVRDARAERREGEVAVPRALGAEGSALARLLLTESVLLSLAAAVVGLAFAWGAVGVLVSTAPVSRPRLDEVGIDVVVVAFTLLLSLVSAPRRMTHSRYQARCATETVLHRDGTFLLHSSTSRSMVIQ